jgi:hypothetical protein
MKKKPLVIGFSNSFATAERFFVEILGRKYDVVREDNNPDYLIHGYFGHDYQNKPFRKKRIFYTGENERPDYFFHSHAITFDHENSSRHYRLPLYILDMYCAQWEGVANTYDYLLNKRISDPEKEYDMKTGFCTYIQSNPKSNVRNDFFNALCQYKKVDAAGPHLNNVGFVLPRDKMHYKVDFCRKYRFNMAFENQTQPGYITEKILNAFYSNTIPIYWGSRTSDRDFNQKSFINCHDFQYFHEVIEYIKHLDSPAGKNEYLDILTQPAFVGNRPNEFMDLDRFVDWWDTFVYEG